MFLNFVLKTWAQLFLDCVVMVGPKNHIPNHQNPISTSTFEDPSMPLQDLNSPGRPRKTTETKVAEWWSCDTAETSQVVVWVRGSPAHTLWSHKYTQAQLCIIFSTQTHPDTQTGVTHTAIFQSHPRTQTGVTTTHRHNFASFFPPRVTRAHITWDRVGWGGDDDMLLHLHTCSKRCAMDCFGTYLTHVQTCSVTRVQRATQWTSSVHTLHMSKPVM